MLFGNAVCTFVSCSTESVAVVWCELRHAARRRGSLPTTFASYVFLLAQRQKAKASCHRTHYTVLHILLTTFLYYVIHYYSMYLWWWRTLTRRRRCPRLGRGLPRPRKTAARPRSRQTSLPSARCASDNGWFSVSAAADPTFRSDQGGVRRRLGERSD